MQLQGRRTSAACGCKHLPVQPWRQVYVSRCPSWHKLLYKQPSDCQLICPATHQPCCVVGEGPRTGAQIWLQ